MVGLDDYWRKDSYDRLEIVLENLAKSAQADLFSDYIHYLDLRRRGLRKQALASAEKFVCFYKNDPFEIRQRVCWELFRCTEPYWDSWPAGRGWLFPGNIEQKLVSPMFEEWRQREPKNVNAWLYPLHGHLEWRSDIAFMLEPNNPRCQFAELTRIGAAIGFALHELDHIGFILASPDEFSEVISALVAVAEAIGPDLSDVAHETLVWLHALRDILTEDDGDLRPLIRARGIKRPEITPLYMPLLWFRHTPQLWSF